MSGFLPKPLVEADLVRVIEQFAAEGDAPDRAGLPQQDHSPLHALKARYVSETHDLFNWLASRPDDMGEMAGRAHQVAGSAAAFGQPDLRDALVAVELAAERGDRDQLDHAVQAAEKIRQTLPDPSLS